MPGEIMRHPDNSFVTASEAIDNLDSVAELDVPHYVSWADVERDLSAWLSNPIQEDALRTIYAFEKDVLQSEDEKTH